MFLVLLIMADSAMSLPSQHAVAEHLLGLRWAQSRQVSG